MAQIVIREVDNTTPQGVAQSTDIVYIPGYADTNFNCYICGEAGVAPSADTEGRVGGSATPSREDYNIHSAGNEFNAQYFVNTYDKKVWYCSAVTEGSPDTYTWTLCGSYVEPYPENTPVLCNSVVEFEKNFGKLPLDIAGGTAVEYDKSYIMARELISAGLPVLYENVVRRYEGYNRGYEPYCLMGFDKAFANISDIGEYSVKYITSGGYPLYGLQTAAHTVTASEATNHQFDISVTGFDSEDDIFSVSIGDKLYTVELTSSPSSSGSVAVEQVTNAVRFYFSSSDTAFVEGAEVVINNIVGVQCKAAYDRGDAIALVDHTDVPGRPLVGSGSVFASVDDTNSIFKTSVTASAFGCKEYGAYCAMFTPYASYQCVAQDGTFPSASRKQILPASFAYLMSLAKSIKTNANWLAVSGVSRGLVPNIVSLNTTQKLTNKIADTYQPKTDVAINAITNIQPYGLTIWGNRTLFANTANGLQAHSFLNTRNMVNEIKKVAYNVAKSLMFEQNSESLWLAFKSGLLPTLNQMQSGQGLSAYKIIRQETAEKYKLSAVIKLYPIYAVEEIEVNIYLENEEVTVQ